MAYQGRFFSEVFFPYCKANDIKQIIHLGDFYDHRKFVNFKVINAVRKQFLEPMRDAGMTMDIIPGNHDVFYRNSNDLCSLKELMGYFIECVNLVMKPKVLEYAGLPIALLPWINPENYADSMQFVENCSAPLLCAHLELKGFEMMKGSPPQMHGMDASNFTKFEAVYTGHYHTKSTRGNVNYLGTQYEMNWGDCDDPKFFHVLDTATRQVTAIRNPLTLFTKIIYNDLTRDYSETDLLVAPLKDHYVKLIVTRKNDAQKFDKFVEAIYGAGVHDLKIAENFEEFVGDNVETAELDVAADTQSLLDMYVDAVETDLDKIRIKTKLRELYVEAQNEIVC
jgi:DNA repair exonuclease SbcCD nuclease subunit